VAPAVLLYLWSVSAIQSLGWAVALLFAVCCALRLARFNTQIGAELPPYAYNFFTGVPAPAAAGLVMIPIIAWFETGIALFRSPVLNGLVLAAVAALMVSRVPTYSFKRIHVPREWVLPFLLFVGAMAAFLTTEPWATLMVVGVLYIGSIPIGILAYFRLRRAADALRASPRELPPQEAAIRSAFDAD
jgi:CDP-diacylglycerol--serine O-phosphatidyltransferase